MEKIKTDESLLRELDSPNRENIIMQLMRRGIKDLTRHEEEVRLPDDIREDMYWYDNEAFRGDDHYSNALALIRAAFVRLRSLINNTGKYPSFDKKALVIFLDQLEKHVYPRFHQSPKIDDEQKLFLEFLIGLAYVEAAGTSALEIAAYLLPDDNEKEKLLTDAKEAFQIASTSVLEGLNAKVDIFNRVSVLLNKRLTPEEYFGKVYEWFQNDPDALAVAQRLVSLRYADDNVPTIGPVQMLHWKGLGGNGEIFKNIPGLEKISELAIGFHTGFDDKLKIFIEMLEKVDRTHCSVTAAHILNMFPQDTVYKIHDFATGPSATAAIQITTEIHSLNERVEVEATASDISVSELEERERELVTQTPGLKSLNIRRLNLLNLDPRQIGKEERGTYHVVSVKLGLHQIVGSEYGRERFGKAVQYFNTLLREGGILSIAKVSEGAEMQYPLIPGNLADREGKVGELVRRGFIENWVVELDECDDPRRYAILVPLYTEMKSWPGGGEGGTVRERLNSSEDRSIYSNNFYMQLRLIPDDYQRLAERMHQTGVFPMETLYDLFTQNDLYKNNERYDGIEEVLKKQVNFLKKQ